MAMNCENVLHHVDAYVRGEIDPRTSKQIEEHIGACDKCRREETAARRIASGLRAMSAQASDALTRSVLSAADGARAGRQRLGWFSPLRAMAACLILGFVLFFTSRGSDLTTPIPMKIDPLPYVAPPVAPPPDAQPPVVAPEVAPPTDATGRGPDVRGGGASIAAPHADVLPATTFRSKMEVSPAPTLAPIASSSDPVSRDEDASAAFAPASPSPAFPPSPASASEERSASAAEDVERSAPGKPKFSVSEPEEPLAISSTATPPPGGQSYTTFQKEPSTPTFRLQMTGSSPDRSPVPEFYFPSSRSSWTEDRPRRNELRALRYRAIPSFADIAGSVRRDTFASLTDSPAYKK